MNEYDLSIALHLAEADFDSGEKLNVTSIAKRTRKLSAQRYGGVDALGHEVLGGVFGRYGTLRDDAEAAKAALQIETGVGRSPVIPKRPSSWAARHAVTVRDKGLDRRRWRRVGAVAAAALLLPFLLRSGEWSWPSVSASEAVHSSFAELIEELGGESTAKGSSPALNDASASWLSTWAADFAKGYRRCRSREGASTEADEITKRLLVFANEQKIKVQFVCPPQRRDGTKLIGDYRWPRQIRLCPGYSGLEGAALVAHELAHHLQGVAGRLTRKPAEDEADAVALTALKALWLPVGVSDGGYLNKPGNHTPALLESRVKIQAMATTLVQAARGAP